MEVRLISGSLNKLLKTNNSILHGYQTGTIFTVDSTQHDYISLTLLFKYKIKLDPIN